MTLSNIAFFLIGCSLLQPSHPVQVTVNNDIAIKKIKQNSEDNNILLTCDYTVSNRAKLETACRNDGESCVMVKWSAFGLENVMAWQTIARPNKDVNAVLPDFTDSFVKDGDSFNLRLGKQVTQQRYNATYKCVVEVDTDTPNMAEGQFDLFVLVPPDMPVLVGNTQPVLNKESQMSCNSLAGSPAPKYKWFKDGVEIDVKKMVEVEKESRSVFDKIFGGSEADEDEPDVRVLSDEQEMRSQQPDYSEPQTPASSPNVKSASQSSSPILKYVIDNDTKTLTINNIIRQDRGTYTCSAYNEANLEGVTSNPLQLEPQAFNFILVGSIAGAVVIVIILFIITCICCQRRAKKNRKGAGHGVVYDKNLQITSGRPAVTPTKSSHTNMTNANSAGFSYTGGNQVSDYGMGNHQSGDWVQGYVGEQGQQQGYGQGQEVVDYSKGRFF